MSRGEKRDTNSFSVRRSPRDSKKNTNERHQRKHQNQRKEATKEKTSTTPPTPRFFRSRERERDLKTYYSGFILIRVCLVSVFILFKVKRQRHLFPSFFTSESRQRDKGVNLFRTINFRLSFLQWLFFCEKLKETQRE